MRVNLHGPMQFAQRKKSLIPASSVRRQKIIPSPHRMGRIGKPSFGWPEAGLGVVLNSEIRERISFKAKDSPLYDPFWPMIGIPQLRRDEDILTRDGSRGELRR